MLSIKDVAYLRENFFLQITHSYGLSFVSILISKEQDEFTQHTHAIFGGVGNARPFKVSTSGTEYVGPREASNLGEVPIAY